MAEKIVVIGIDSGDPDLALRWAREGKLPNLQRLIERGAGGTLLSSPNAISPSAWSSFATGLNPGRHGIFYFLDRKPGTYELMHSSTALRSGQSFWRTLSDAGKKVAVLHEPITFPAEPINGVHICGWLAPSMNTKGFTHPPQLIEEIRRLFPEFVLHTGMVQFIRRQRYDEALARKLQLLRMKGKIARWVWEQEDWDCFVTVFQETDPISHYYWHFMDEQHPDHRETAHRYDTAILDVYQAIDEEIGRLMEMVPESAHVFVMSDHGSCRNSRGQLYVKPLLRELGLEVRKSPGRKNALVRTAFKLSEHLPAHLRHWAAGLMPRSSARLLRASATGDVDFAQSRAYTFWANSTSEPWLNVAGRDPLGMVQPGAEYDGIVAQITDALMKAVEAGTGQPLVQRVERADAIYHGQHVNRAPDMLVTWNDTVVQAGLRTRSEGREIVLSEPSAQDLRQGVHRQQGLLIAAGPRIAPAAPVSDVHIEDLPATILAMLGVPSAEPLDGHVRHELVSGVSELAPESGVQQQSGSAYTEEEEAAIEERLADLGYL